MKSFETALRRGLLGGLVVTLALCASPGRAGDQAAASETGGAAASWAVLDAVTKIGLDAATLSGLGFELETLAPRIARHVPHPLSVAPPDAPSFGADGPIGLRAAVTAGGFRGFEGGSLRHRGGFRLRGATHTVDLSHLELRPGRKASSLELLDAEGVALLATFDAQWELDAKRGLLRYLNADLRILPALARRLGDERYTGVTVGVLALDATLRVGPVPPAPRPAEGAAPPPCGDWSGVIDVGLVDMSGFGQAGGTRVVNGRSVTVVLPSAELRNVGTANVPWYSKFTNLGQPHDDQHPFLVWQMLRVHGGVLEPIGRSDLKHAFLTSNDGCDPGACTDPHILGLGCTDNYNTVSNNSVGALGPRSEVTASTGTWAHCGGVPTHFDTNGDCVQDFFGAGEDPFTHGMKVAETDLQVSGAAYYVEAFYIVRDDTNIFNSMGYRQVAPAKPGSLWTFPHAAPYIQGPAINAWVFPPAPGPNAANQTLDTGEGRVQLAVRVFDVPGNPGRRRFAYALQNHDFDRRIRSFHVPFNPVIGVIENVVYSDGDGYAANDWTWTVDATGITWTVPDTPVTPPTPPAELDYASLVSFRFDSDQTAAPAEARLDVFEPGPPGSPVDLRLQTLAPATGGPPPTDYYTLAPCRLLDTRVQPGGPAPIPSETVRELDVVAAGCGVPAQAIAVAVNVTAVGASSGGEIAVYSSAEPPATAGTVSFGPGATRANNAISLLSLDGKMKIRPSLSAGGSVHVVVDVVGYFAPGNP